MSTCISHQDHSFCSVMLWLYLNTNDISELICIASIRNQSLSFPSVDIQETCNIETFERSCGSDEVLVVNSAKFGRMALGTCITKGYGEVGCYKDVTDILSGRCAGKQACSMMVWKNDDEFMESYPCDSELPPYLETDTICQPGKYIKQSSHFMPLLVYKPAGIKWLKATKWQSDINSCLLSDRHQMWPYVVTYTTTRNCEELIQFTFHCSHSIIKVSEINFHQSVLTHLSGLHNTINVFKTGIIK